MKTFEAILKEATDELQAAGVPEAEVNAWHLFAWAVAVSREAALAGEETTDESDVGPVMRLKSHMPNRAWYMLHEQDEADEITTETLERLVGYRKKGCPLEYITHYTEFMGLPFYVDPSVLIPRQDTECLVEEALKLCGERKKDRNVQTDGVDVLDLCTGSGCIAVSLAILGACRSVTATDKSVEALAVARKNADLNQVGEGAPDGSPSVRFIHSDLWEKVDGTYDLITCNPPYIRRDVIPTLMPEVQAYEPMMALDGGEDGLDFYRRILEKIKPFLRKDGYLICEIGYDQGEAVASLMRKAGLTDVQVKQDLAGLDRIVMGRR